MPTKRASRSRLPPCDVLMENFSSEGVFIWEEDTPLPDVVALARWREVRK